MTKHPPVLLPHLNFPHNFYDTEESAVVCLPWHHEIFLAFAHDLLNVAIGCLYFTVSHLLPLSCKAFKEISRQQCDSIQKNVFLSRDYSQFSIRNSYRMKTKGWGNALYPQMPFFDIQTCLEKPSILEPSSLQIKNQNKTFWPRWMSFCFPALKMFLSNLERSQPGWSSSVFRTDHSDCDLQEALGKKKKKKIIIILCLFVCSSTSEQNQISESWHFLTKENGVVPTQQSCSGRTRKGLLNNWQEQEVSKGGKNEPGEGLKEVSTPVSEVSPDLNCSVSMNYTKNTPKPKQELHHHPPQKRHATKKTLSSYWLALDRDFLQMLL